MRVLATTGYYGSGSSAVTDLMREYANVCQPSGTDTEISFFFGYHGIGNLYYWIVRGRRLQNLAVKDFLYDAKRVATLGRKMNYEKYFKGNFYKHTKKYIQRIQGDNYGVGYVIDLMRLSSLQLFVCRVVNKIYSLLNEIYNLRSTDRRQSTTRLFKKRESLYLYNISKETFIVETKRYLFSLFNEISEGKDIIMVDGLIATHNIDDISMYFDDLRVVIVDRDPRDIYLSEKYVWKTGVVPEEPNNFCAWYSERKKMISYDRSNVLNIKFEDLIFKYNDTVRALELFFGLDSKDHVDKNKYFVPGISQNNCRLWNRYKGEEEAMRIIKKELSDCIYPFPS